MMAKTLLYKFPKKWINRFYKVYNLIAYPDMIEERKTYGDLNKNEILYIIRPRTDCIEGLMALFLNVMKNLHYAEVNGYIPIVDFENYKTQYQDTVNGNKNAWEFYFMQPTKYSLQEAYKSSNVILSGLNALVLSSDYIEQSFDEEMMYRSRRLVEKYIRFSPAVYNTVLCESKNWDMKKTLGLYLRGTDYTKLKPAGHPVQPSFQQAMKKADEIMKKNKLSHVFLVTEDAEIYKEAKKYYGNRLLTVSYDTYISGYTGEKYLGRDEKSVIQLADTPYKRGLNYLVKLIILSQCNSFVGGNTCGSWAACSFNKKGFQDQYVFDLGRY